MVLVLQHSIENSSIECCKTKTKRTTLCQSQLTKATYNTRLEPIKTQSEIHVADGKHHEEMHVSKSRLVLYFLLIV